MNSLDPSQPIDFEKEVRRLMKKQVTPYTREVHVVSLCKSIAARVEESTIQRCIDAAYFSETPCADIKEMPRLYGSKAGEGR